MTPPIDRRFRGKTIVDALLEERKLVLVFHEESGIIFRFDRDVIGDADRLIGKQWCGFTSQSAGGIAYLAFDVGEETPIAFYAVNEDRSPSATLGIHCHFRIPVGRDQ